MKQSNLAKVYRRKIAEAKAEQARWQSKIDAAPPGTTNQQIGVWRGKLRDARHQERAVRRRLQAITKGVIS